MDEHLVYDLPHARAVFTTRRGGVSAGRFAVAQPRPADRRRARERRREPAPRRRARRPPVGALPLRQAGPRDRRGHRQRPPRRRRPGDGEGRRARRSSSAPTACRSCSPPRAPSPRCTAATGRWPAGSSPTASRRCATLGGNGPITALIGPGARGCCYEVGPEVHARFTTGRHGDQPRPRGGRDRRSSATASRSTTSGSARSATSASSPTAREGETGRQSGVICRA